MVAVIGRGGPTPAVKLNATFAISVTGKSSGPRKCRPREKSHRCRSELLPGPILPFEALTVVSLNCICQRTFLTCGVPLRLYLPNDGSSFYKWARCGNSLSP